MTDTLIQELELVQTELQFLRHSVPSDIGDDLMKIAQRIENTRKAHQSSDVPSQTLIDMSAFDVAFNKHHCSAHPSCRIAALHLINYYLEAIKPSEILGNAAVPESDMQALNKLYEHIHGLDSGSTDATLLHRIYHYLHSYRSLPVREISLDFSAAANALEALEKQYDDFELLGLGKDIARICAETWGLIKITYREGGK